MKKVGTSGDMYVTSRRGETLANQVTIFDILTLSVNLQELSIFTWGSVPRSMSSCLSSDHFHFFSLSPVLHIEWRISNHFTWKKISRFIKSEKGRTKAFTYYDKTVDEEPEILSGYFNSEMRTVHNVYCKLQNAQTSRNRQLAGPIQVN